MTKEDLLSYLLTYKVLMPTGDLLVAPLELSSGKKLSVQYGPQFASKFPENFELCVEDTKDLSFYKLQDNEYIRNFVPIEEVVSYIEMEGGVTNRNQVVWH
jgi:hypothetical protein